MCEEDASVVFTPDSEYLLLTGHHGDIDSCSIESITKQKMVFKIHSFGGLMHYIL